MSEQVTTREELDALPDRSVVLDSDGDAWAKEGDIWVLGINRWDAALLLGSAPLAVLHIRASEIAATLADVYLVRVPGLPRPQGSKRHVGNGRMVESSPYVDPWRERVALAARAAHGGQLDGALHVTVCFSLPRPKGHYRTGRNAHLLRDGAPDYPTTRPDLDKLTRAILDALTGVWWADDSLVVGIDALKVFGQPGVTVRAQRVGS